MNEFEAAIASFKNETTLGLVNVNVDLALVKFEAPPEFSSVGKTISKRRKESAEDGELHKTARKLGELFKGILPRTPKLLRAYGNRVSEVSSQSAVNPQGLHFKDGIFAAHVGIDSGSLWAAATSGSAAIAVHLLACMLARVFTIEEATSIWVELVEQHKMQLEASAQDDLYPDGQLASRLAVVQDITRQELAVWDASARSWLQSADQEKLWHHKQFKIIINDSSIPVNEEPAMYTSVISAWTTALEAMESLVQGVPQKVQDGAVLLAISAWHLYPDLMVYRGRRGMGVEIKMRDPIFPPTALLTIGLEATRPGSVSWSLPLSRMQYYGDTVRVTASSGQDNTRLTPQEFSYVILGLALGEWKLKDFCSTVKHILFWTGKIIECAHIPSARSKEKATLDFIAFLHQVADTLDRCEGLALTNAEQLFNLGHRRSHTFLDSQEHTIRPLLGLGDPPALFSLFRSTIEGDRPAAIDEILPIYKTQPPQFLLQTKSKSERYSVLWDGRTQWIMVNSLDIQHYQEHKNLPPGLDSELVARNTPCFPALAVERTEESFDNARFDFQDFEIDGQSDRKQSVFGSGRKFTDIRFGTGTDFADALMSLRHRPGTFFPDFERSELSYSSTPTRYDTIYKRHVASKDVVETFFCLEKLEGNSSLRKLDNSSIKSLFTPKDIDPAKLQDLLLRIGSTKQAVALAACAAVVPVLESIPGSSVTTRVVDQPFHAYDFFSNDDLKHELSLSSMLSVLCTMESGMYIPAQQIRNAFALATGNSIYVASAMVTDPSEIPHMPVHRVTGNIGQAGLCFLVPPASHKLSPPADQNWRVINHFPFDGKLEDNFENTSVHLSFTGYELGLRASRTVINYIDNAAKLVETAISAYDGSRWVADLDISVVFSDQADWRIWPLREDHRQRMGCKDTCSGVGCNKMETPYEDAATTERISGIISINNWDEILDPPLAPVILIRATDNWIARLALLAVCCQKEYRVLVASGRPCWPHLIGDILKIEGMNQKWIGDGCRPHECERAESNPSLEDASWEDTVSSQENPVIIYAGDEDWYKDEHSDEDGPSFFAQYATSRSSNNKCSSGTATELENRVAILL